MAIVIPEIILKETLEIIFSYLKDEANNPDKDSLIYNLFGKTDEEKNLAYNRFNYFDESKKIFAERVPQVYMGYNFEVSDIPAVHIILPSEQSDPLTIGADEGYQDAIISENGRDFVYPLTMTASSTYQLIISSPNSSEVILIYHALRACLLSVNEHLEFRGLRLPTIGGADLQIQSDIIPPNIFHRSLMISFKYEITSYPLLWRKIIKKINTPTQVLLDGNVKIQTQP